MHFPIKYFYNKYGTAHYDFKWSQVEISKLRCISVPDSKVVVIKTNNEGPDEMQHYAAFHLGIHCLQKYSKTCLKQPLKKNTKNWFSILVIGSAVAQG